MSYQAVRTYFERAGIADHITEHDQTGDTVEHAARTIGCTPAEIAKALSFLVDGKPVMVVMAGDAKVNSSKFKVFFSSKACHDLLGPGGGPIGHTPGGVCPFAVNEGVAVYLDASLKRFSVIHTAAGTDMATIRLTMAELEEHAHAAGWVDVCKGWFANEGMPA